MSLFGKILAVFNVLAAIAFFSIAAMDYSARSQWSYSHFRHQLALHGMPVDKHDDAWRLSGRTIQGDLTENSLKDIYQSVGGDPSVTQIEELNKLQAAIQNEVNNAPDIEAKRAVLARYLIPIQNTGEDREKIRAQIAAAKTQTEVEALWNTFVGIFDDAKKENGESKRDLLTRRQLIADLLYNIRSDNLWQARVQTVVGLDQYSLAADRQAERLAKMSQRMRDAIADERTKFVTNYMVLIPELENLNKELKRYDERLTEQKSLLNRYTAMKNARTAEVAELNQQIQEATRIVAAETAHLHALEARLFAVQKQLAAAQAENLKLEREIRTSEAGK
jgi:predicted XRE-type DNA-binding protein